MYDAPFYHKMSPSRAFPKLTGSRKLIFYLRILRTRIEAQGLYWRPRAPGDPSYNVWHHPPPHTMYGNPPPPHTMYGSLLHTMYEPPRPLHTIYEALRHTMYGKLSTLTSWRLDQENQVSTPRQKQLQNCYLRLWFWYFFARGDPWLCPCLGTSEEASPEALLHTMYG